MQLLTATEFKTAQKVLFDSAGLISTIDLERFVATAKGVKKHGPALAGLDVSVDELVRLAESARKFKRVTDQLLRLAQARAKSTP